MSGAGVLGREQAAEARRWEQPVLGVPASAATAAAPRTVRQLEALEQQAREEGHAQGLAEGRAAAALELAQRVREVESLLDALARPLDGLDDAVELELAQLAIAIARQLVRRELRTQPDEVISVVREGLAALPAASRHVRVQLHPADAQLVRQALARGEGEHAWEIREDPLLTRGGCEIVSEHSRLDARVEARLGAVIAAVLGGARNVDADSGEGS